MMKISNSVTAVLCFAIGAFLPSAALGQSAQPDADSGKWQFTATLYGWVPIVDGQVNFPDDKGSTGIHVSMKNVLSHLKMTFQGSLDANNGHWGIFNDIVYVLSLIHISEPTRPY